MALEAMLQQTQCLFEEREEIFMYIMKILIDREKKNLTEKQKYEASAGEAVWAMKVHRR